MPMQVHIVLLAPFLVLALWVIWRAVTLPRWVRARPVCGACGYEFTGGSRCPECGREVAEAGVATRRLALRLRGSAPAAAAALLFLVLVLWFFVADLVQQRLSQIRFMQVSAKLTLLPEDFASPLPRVALEKETIARGDQVASGVLKVSIPSGEAPNVPTAEVGLPSGQVQVVDPSGRVLLSQQEFDRRVLEPLFAAVDLDVDDPALAAEADDIMAWVLDEIHGGPMFGDARKLSANAPSLYVAQATMNSRPAEPPRVLGLPRDLAWMSAVALGCVALYVALLAAMLWRRRQLTRQATAPRGYPPAVPGPAPVPQEA